MLTRVLSGKKTCPARARTLYTGVGACTVQRGEMSRPSVECVYKMRLFTFEGPAVADIIGVGSTPYAQWQISLIVS